MNTVIDKNNSYEFAHILLDMGEAMLCSGAEINRIEDTFLKLGVSYNVKEINVFVIPALITLTIRTNDGFELTQSRRILSKKITTNLYRLEKLNNIAHNCRNQTYSLDVLKKLILDSNKPVSIYPFLFGSALAAASFSVFFGGSLYDGLIAGLIAFLICFFQRFVSNIVSNRIILSFLCSLFIGMIIVGLGKNLSCFHTDEILIGDIMLLIPGIAVTISVRDIILGDTISGSLRLIDSMFLTGGLALGFWLSFVLFGG